MKIFLVAIFLFCVPISKVNAQTPSHSPTAKQLILASQILELTGYRQSIENMIRGTITPNQFRNYSVSNNDPYKAAKESSVDKQISKLMPKYEKIYSEEYAENFTELELSEILNFYNSPAGQALLHKRTMTAYNTIYSDVTKIAPDLKQQIIADFCANVHCGPHIDLPIAPMAPR